MPDFTVQDAPKFDLIEENTVLRAKLTEIKDKKLKSGHEKWEWNFLVDDPDSEHDGRKIRGETWAELYPSDRCAAYIWARELLGQELPVGFDGNTDLFVGRYARIVIGQRSYDTTDKQTGEPVTKTINEITDVIRIAETAGEDF